MSAIVNYLRFAELRTTFSAVRPVPRAPGLSEVLAGLLAELNWRGDVDVVLEALPYFESDRDATALRNALCALGYRTSVAENPFERLESLPHLFLFQPEGRSEVELIRRSAPIGSGTGGFTTFADGAYWPLTDEDLKRRGSAFFVNKIEASDAERAEAVGSWFERAFRQFGSALNALLVISFAGNVLAIATPLFVMVVYDKVIGQSSGASLPMLALGVAVVLGFDLALRLAKSHVLARVAGRFDYILGVSVFHKLLNLPAARTERASASAQIARLKEFESVRDFFTGPLANAFVELPFVAVMVLAMALIGGPLVLVPLAAGLVFVGVAFVCKPRSGELERQLGQVRADRQSLLVDTVMNRTTVTRARAERTWLDRFRIMSARDCSLQERLARRAAVLEGVSSAVLNLSALGMLVWGATRALSGDMTVGALIATMALAWRVLAPIQTTALALAKLNQIGAAIRQTNQFFKLREEFATVTKTLRRSQEKGAIAFNRVSFRYDQGADPALLGVSFTVAPGEAFAITGANRSGKTTLFKLLLGLHAPQAGNVLIDGVDVRQLDPRRMRRRIAYAPQAIHLFYGTIRQNLTFGHPSASEELIAHAVAAAGLEPFLAKLPEGLDTRIGDGASERLPRGFTRRLTIARALCRPSDILLLDEPEQGLDPDGERMLTQLFADLKGKKTILLISYRPSFVALADRALWLTGGAVEAMGPAAELAKRARTQTAPPGAQHSAQGAA